MIGIYQITNVINNHCYIGQSRNISQRWANHKVAATNPTDKGYDYPLYRAIRKYGITNFKFEVLEECEILNLNEKEIFWISQNRPEYNQTVGGNQSITFSKLTPKQVEEIQWKLSTESFDSMIKLAEEYDVHRDTIYAINQGRSWVKDGLQYPLWSSKTSTKNPHGSGARKQTKFCTDCGAPVTSSSRGKCVECSHKATRKAERPSRNELKDLIRFMPFTKIGERYNVTDNAIRKWCKAANLPSRVKDIKSFTNEEWTKV